jgi:hypothetical protein
MHICCQQISLCIDGNVTFATFDFLARIVIAPPFCRTFPESMCRINSRYTNSDFAIFAQNDNKMNLLRTQMRCFAAQKCGLRE